MDFAAFVASPALAYLVIAGLVAADAVIPLLPSEVAVVTAGTLVAAGELDLAPVLVMSIVGALAGDSTVYLLGRHALPGALARTRPGRRIQRGVERTYTRMGSATAMAIIAGRFVPMGRTASSAAAGAAGVAPQRFVLWGAIGGTVWAAWLLGVGYITGSVTDAPLWAQSAIGAAAVIVVGVWIAAGQAVIRTRRRMSARAAAHERAMATPSPSDAEVEPSAALGRMAA